MTATRDIDAWTRPERFAQAEVDPQHAIALALPASQLPLVSTVVVPIGQATFVAAFAAVFAVVLGEVVGLGDRTRSIAVVVAVAVGLVALAVTVGLVLRKWRAPARRRLAVIVDERTEVWRSRRGGATRTLYFATLELADGTRAECVTTSGVASLAVPGDIGLAVVRAGTLVDFHRYRLRA